MRFVFGALILIAFAALAYINRASPILVGALLLTGTILCGFMSAGRFEGDSA